MIKPICVLSAFLFTAGLISCNDQKRTSEVTVVQDTAVPVQTVAQTSATEGNSLKITTAEVPDSVRLSFTKKYPKGTVSQWVKYIPAESDYMAMDREYYYVIFMNNGEDITSWYDNRGEWVKTSTKIKGDPRLPDAVNKTINAQYPGYVIEEVSKENDKDMDMYEVKLNKGDAKAKLKILPNGEVFKRK